MRAARHFPSVACRAPRSLLTERALTLAGRLSRPLLAWTGLPPTRLPRTGHRPLLLAGRRLLARGLLLLASGRLLRPRAALSWCLLSDLLLAELLLAGAPRESLLRSTRVRALSGLTRVRLAGRRGRRGAV